MGCGWSIVAKFLATSGFGSVVGFDRIPGSFAFFDGMNDVRFTVMIHATNAAGNEDETCESQHRGLFDFPCV